MTAAALTIHERMVAILAALPPVGKDQKNVQQGFMFRGHDDVMNALNPLLGKHGVFVLPDVLERITAQRTTAKGSIMFEVNLHVRFRFYGAAGDVVEASAWGEGTDSGDKATNKAMTMAFKNVLNQAFAISNKETADADHETPPETVSKGSRGTDGTQTRATGGASPQKGGGHPPDPPPAPAAKTNPKLQQLLDLGKQWKQVKPEWDENELQNWLTKKPRSDGELDAAIATYTENIQVAQSPFQIPTEPKGKAA